MNLNSFFSVHFSNRNFSMPKSAIARFQIPLLSVTNVKPRLLVIGGQFLGTRPKNWWFMGKLLKFMNLTHQQMVVNISWYIYIILYMNMEKTHQKKQEIRKCCSQLEAVDMFWFDDASGPRVPQVFGHLRLPRVEVQVFGHRAGIYLGY